MLPFLLEVGAEEIPDWMIPAALEQLGKDFQAVLDGHKLGGKVTRTDGTGRRLVLWAEGLIPRQADSEEIVSGPPKGANPKAVEGFAKKNGVSVDELKVETTAKGEYFTFRRQVAGRATGELLAELLPDLILKLNFPKSMFWTVKGGPKFIRPIRWIVALLGDDVVSFELAGVWSSNETYGHRQLGTRKAISVTIASYETELENNFVIVSSDARRAKIEKELKALIPNDETSKLVQDEALLSVLTFITEYPSVIRGEFDPAYLYLPGEVLTTVMRHHQKYFSVGSVFGTIRPYFLAVMNIPADVDGNVRRGNERVLRARFNDAQFFFDLDCKRSLFDRVEDLKKVTFHAKLGTYFEKAERIEEIARNLALWADFGKDSPYAADRPLAQKHAAIAARLAKADLTTEMVKEFTDLQGVMGGVYCKKDPNRTNPPVSSEISDAIADHYRPVSMDGPLPINVLGEVVALADRLDTLRRCFNIGMMPSGSKDPFALRRAAQGVVRLLVEGSVSLPSQDEHEPTWLLHHGDSAVQDFYRDRLQYYFRDVQGFAKDEVNAVLAAGWGDLKDVAMRLKAVKAIRPTPNFEPVAAAFKRIKNILTQAGTLPVGAPDASLFNEAEAGVAAAAAQAAIKDGGYAAQLERIAGLRPAIDHFFDEVLVNDPDPVVRDNRLRLLNQLITEFSSIADFSEIVTKSL